MTQHNTIRILSDSELLNNLDTLNRRERTITVEILLHLNEVERRKLHLRRGYPSLFRYCTDRLGYSESAAGRRIRTARCVRKYPEILALLSEGVVNVCTISIVAGILTRENKTEILRDIQGKSQRDVESVAARYRPERAVHDRVWPVTVWRRVAIKEPASTDGAKENSSTREMSAEGSARPALDGRTSAGSIDVSKNGTGVGPANRCPETAVDLDAATKCKDSYRRSGGKNLTTTAQRPGEGTGFVLEQKFKLEFTVSAEFMKKLDEVKALLSTRHPVGIEFAQLFETLLDEFIDRHSPVKKRERREKRKARGNEGEQTTRETRNVQAAPAKPVNEQLSASNKRANGDRPTPTSEISSYESYNKPSRYISPALRDEVFKRDCGRCTYVCPSGKRCNSTWNLQVDHIDPHARGGSNTLGNLRLLCGNHNRLEAERIMGEVHMAQYYRRE